MLHIGVSSYVKNHHLKAAIAGEIYHTEKYCDKLFLSVAMGLSQSIF